MKKKLLCLVLAMAMILTVVPAQAFALDFDLGSSIMDSLKDKIKELIQTRPEEPEEVEYYKVTYTDQAGKSKSIVVEEGTWINLYSAFGLGDYKYVDDDVEIYDLSWPIDTRYQFVGWKVEGPDDWGEYDFTAVWDFVADINVAYKSTDGAIKTAIFHAGDTLNFYGDEEKTDLIKSVEVGKSNLNIASVYGLAMASPGFAGWKVDGKDFIAQWTTYTITYRDYIEGPNAEAKLVKGNQYKVVNGSASNVYTITNDKTISDLVDGDTPFRGWEASSDENYGLILTAKWGGADEYCVITYGAIGTDAPISTTVPAAQGSNIVIDPGEGTYGSKNSEYVEDEIKGDMEIASPNPREGYTFLGWKYEVDADENVTFTATYKQNAQTLYFDEHRAAENAIATSVAIGYGDLITINTDGGKYIGSKSFNVTSQSITIGAATLIGSTFDGWTYSKEQKTSNYSEITLTANWKNVRTTTSSAYDVCKKGSDCILVANNVTDATGRWSHDAVHFVLQEGIMVADLVDGSSPAALAFRPTEAAIRSEVICALYALENDQTYTSCDEIKTAAVDWATKAGILLGNETGDLLLDEKITRQDFTAMLLRYAAHFYGELDEDVIENEFHFIDEGFISLYAVKPVQWAVRVGIILGFDDGRIDPKGDITREQLATILLRTNELYDILH